MADKKQQEKSNRPSLSKYAKKVSSGHQMYGPGCCAHTVSNSQIAKRKEEARARGHFRGRTFFESEDARPTHFPDGGYPT